MVKIFWIDCPGCQGSFYADYHDFKGRKNLLLCPYCGKRFNWEEGLNFQE